MFGHYKWKQHLVKIDYLMLEHDNRLKFYTGN